MNTGRITFGPGVPEAIDRLRERAQNEATAIALNDLLNESRNRIAALEADLDRYKANAALHAQSVDDLLKEVAQLRKDAERYCWLRDKNTGPSQIWELLSDDCQPPYQTLKCGDDLDVAIDAAMKRSEK